MSLDSGTDRWYRAVIYTLVVMALFSPALLAVDDAVLTALCLPGVCSKGGCLTLWGLILTGIVYGVLIRFVPFV